MTDNDVDDDPFTGDEEREECKRKLSECFGELIDICGDVDFAIAAVKAYADSLEYPEEPNRPRGFVGVTEHDHALVDKYKTSIKRCQKRENSKVLDALAKEYNEASGRRVSAASVKARVMRIQKNIRAHPFYEIVKRISGH